jgi:hypothetical protein
MRSAELLAQLRELLLDVGLPDAPTPSRLDGSRARAWAGSLPPNIP